jgi:hypothetical protein
MFLSQERNRRCTSPANSAENGPETPQRMENFVRSELIFRAKQTIENKYKLCQTASKATRHLHISAKNTTDTINNAFTRIADGSDTPILVDPVQMPV